MVGVPVGHLHVRIVGGVPAREPPRLPGGEQHLLVFVVGPQRCREGVHRSKDDEGLLIRTDHRAIQ